MKYLKSISLAALAALALVVTVLASGSVYDRSIVAVPTAGSITFTNTVNYSAIILKNIWELACPVTNDVMTIKRVSSGGSYTQTVGTVTCSTLTYGNTTSFTATYLKPGDMLTFSSSLTTNSTVMLEYEVQQQ